MTPIAAEKTINENFMDYYNKLVDRYTSHSKDYRKAKIIGYQIIVQKRKPLLQTYLQLLYRDGSIQTVPTHECWVYHEGGEREDYNRLIGTTHSYGELEVKILDWLLQYESNGDYRPFWVVELPDGTSTVLDPKQITWKRADVWDALAPVKPADQPS